MGLQRIRPNWATFTLLSRFLGLLGFLWGCPDSSVGKESTCDAEDLGSIPRSARSPGRGHGNPLQYSCLENSHGQRSLVGYSPWGQKESDMTELRTKHKACVPECERIERKNIWWHIVLNMLIQQIIFKYNQFKLFFSFRFQNKGAFSQRKSTGNYKYTLTNCILKASENRLEH